MYRQIVRASLRCSVVPNRTCVHLASTAESAVRPYSEIPGPKPLPIIGNAWRFLPLIGSFNTDDFAVWIQQMYDTYGPISKVTNIPGKRDMVFIYDPRDFETVLRNEGQWPERLQLEALPYYRKVTRKEFFDGEGGVLVENGEVWKQSRSFVNPVMMQPRNARMYADRIDVITQEFVNNIPGMLDGKKETPEDFSREIQKWALESISMIALDTRLGCLEPNLSPDSEPYRLITAADTVLDLVVKLDLTVPVWKVFPTPAWRRFVKALDVFTEAASKHIEKAQKRLIENANEDEHNTSVLEKLLKRDPNPKKAVVMALDMMLAGIDTTSYTAAGVLYHLARNPEVQEKLHKELCEALPNPDSPLTIDVLDSLKYLKACVKENNRTNPVAPGMGRCTPVDTVLSNYQVPKGTDIMICAMLSSNLDKNFQKPKVFNPERWLNLRECPAENKHHPFTMLPFGYGKRMCVGMRFALMEIESLVARVVRKYRLEWHHADMRFKATGVYAPVDPLRLRVFPRNQ